MSAALVVGSTCATAEEDKLGPEFVLFLERCSALDTALDITPGRLSRKFSAAATLMFGVMSTPASSDSLGSEMPAGHAGIESGMYISLAQRRKEMLHTLRTHTLCEQPHAVF